MISPDWELSQVGFARIVGVGDRQVRRWAAGDSAVPSSIAELLSSMIASKISAAAVEDS
jgi:DNA-binding transcriptional regulator YiaG